MIKKCFNWMLMVSMVCCLSLGVTSCKDDDDNNNESKNVSADPLDNDEARTAWRWLCTLTNTESLDANWQSKTYEPTVGEPSANNEFTRIIIVDDLDDAKEHFASLADKETSELAGKVTIDGGAAGTMVWEPSKAGAENIAVVTVNSRIMPHLQKLVYCTEDQKGQNGSLFGNNMKGTPYYRFGDVIQDPDGYYWVCVRPSFAPINKECKSKGDSHWINIINDSYDGDNEGLPDANVKKNWNNLEKYNHQTILLPTGLSYSREHIYNLSQLIWALIDPEAYAHANEGVTDAALGGFPYTYNGQKFVQTVAAYWDDLGIWKKLFNHNYEEMKKLDEINFFYQGYSWTFGETGYCWLYTSTGYQKSCTGKESNDKKQFNFVREGFDITHFAYSSDGKKPWKRFYEQDDLKKSGTWVVRYKKGDELMTAGKYDYYAAITSSHGITYDTYRYNDKKGIAAGSEVTPETEETFVKPEKDFVIRVGCILGSDYQLYMSAADAYAAGVKPIAIVVRAPDPRIENDVLEFGSEYHYMAMAVTDVGPAAWAADENSFGICASVETDYDFVTFLDGSKWTETMAWGCNRRGHSHPIANACRSFVPEGSTEAAHNTDVFSNWFLPSAGQWVKAITGLDSEHIKWNYNSGKFPETIEGNTYDTLRSLFLNAGVGDCTPSGTYWTCTNRSQDIGCFIKLELDKAITFSEEYDEDNAIKTKQYKARPFILF